MAYNEFLAERIRTTLSSAPGITEKKMFGGVGFMLNGNMLCGVHKDWLIIRVGAESHDSALELPGTKVFDITGRSMKGWIMVEPEMVESESSLQDWIELGHKFAESLPPK